MISTSRLKILVSMITQERRHLGFLKWYHRCCSVDDPRCRCRWSLSALCPHALHVSVCFAPSFAVILPSFYQRGTLKHWTVLSTYIFPGFHRRSPPNHDSDWRCSGALWDLPLTLEWAVWWPKVTYTQHSKNHLDMNLLKTVEMTVDL